MKYKKDSKVRVREDLLVGMEYSNEQGTVFENVTFKMKRYLGKEAIIVNVREGKYQLNIDNLFLFTDNMLELIEEPVELINFEVEEIVENMLRLIPEQLINDAIDKGDEKRFKQLSEQFFGSNRLITS